MVTVWLIAFPAGVATGVMSARGGRRVRRAVIFLLGSLLAFIAASGAGVLAAPEAVSAAGRVVTGLGLATWWALLWSAGHLVPHIFRSRVTILCWAIGGAMLLGYASILYGLTWACGVMQDCILP